jgi:hypothetical protein
MPLERIGAIPVGMSVTIPTFGIVMTAPRTVAIARVISTVSGMSLTNTTRENPSKPAVSTGIDFRV